MVEPGPSPGKLSRAQGGIGQGTGNPLARVLGSEEIGEGDSQGQGRKAEGKP